MASEVIDKAMELFDACGDRPSWESGLCNRLAKSLLWMACQRELTRTEETALNASLENYCRRSGMREVYANAAHGQEVEGGNDNMPQL